MDIVKALERLRIRAGYNKVGMAKSAGLKPRTWSDWESEDKSPYQLKALVNLAIHHNVSVDFILGLTDETRPVTGRELSEAERELLEVFESMPQRARGAALASVKAIGDYANDIIASDMATDSAAALGGSDDLMQLKDLLFRLTIRFGSVDAAVDYLATLENLESARGDVTNKSN